MASPRPDLANETRSELGLGQMEQLLVRTDELLRRQLERLDHVVA